MCSSFLMILFQGGKKVNVSSYKVRNFGKKYGDGVTCYSNIPDSTNKIQRYVFEMHKKQSNNIRTKMLIVWKMRVQKGAFIFYATFLYSLISLKKKKNVCFHN